MFWKQSIPNIVRRVQFLRVLLGDRPQQMFIRQDAGVFFGQHEGLSRGITALILNMSVAAKDVPASTNSVVGRRESVLGCRIQAEVLPISISGFLKLFDINLIQKGTGMRS